MSVHKVGEFKKMNGFFCPCWSCDQQVAYPRSKFVGENTNKGGKVILLSMAIPAINKSISSTVLPVCLSVEYYSAEILAEFSVIGITKFSVRKSSKTLSCFKAFLASYPPTTS